MTWHVPVLQLLGQSAPPAELALQSQSQLSMHIILALISATLGTVTPEDVLSEQQLCMIP